MEALVFKESAALSFGIELELQILNPRDYDLTRGASDLLRLAEKKLPPGNIKPEITESMIEVSTSVHTRYRDALDELREIREVVTQGAERLNLRIAGGGSHPFQKWSDQRIFPKPRFDHLSELYGYLAKQFTVFGQHVHIGCRSGDEAIYLAHMMSRYIPHFVALSAASPFYQGVDTAFDSSRLNTVNAFPLSGTMPFVETWDAFNDYFERMRGFGIVESMKDFYWDIRPKPEYGTIEIRVCDTPLTVEKAAALAAYAQSLAAWLLKERPHQPSQDIYRVYSYNRFLACRFGLEANFIDAYTQAHVSLRDDILDTLQSILPHGITLECQSVLHAIRESVVAARNDSAWLRDAFKRTGTLNDVARLQAELWSGDG